MSAEHSLVGRAPPKAGCLSLLSGQTTPCRCHCCFTELLSSSCTPAEAPLLNQRGSNKHLISQKDAVIPWIPAVLGGTLHSSSRSLATSQKEFKFHWVNGRGNLWFYLSYHDHDAHSGISATALWAVFWKMGSIPKKDNVTTYVPFCLNKGRLPWISLATSQTSKRKDGQKLLLEQPRKVRTFFFWKRQDFASKFLVLKSGNLGSWLRSQTLDEVSGCSAKVISHPWHIWYLLMFSELSGLNQSWVGTLKWEPASDKHIDLFQMPNQHVDSMEKLADRA